MLGSTKEEKDYVVLELEPDNEEDISVSLTSLDKDGYVGSHVSNVNSLNDMNVVIIHDSFYMHSKKQYHRTFKNITEIHLSDFTEECFNTVLQKKQKIDLVIIFLVERNVIGHAADFEKAAAQIARDSERGE